MPPIKNPLYQNLRKRLLKSLHRCFTDVGVWLGSVRMEPLILRDWFNLLMTADNSVVKLTDYPFAI
jgi:hypothetical protein